MIRQGQKTVRVFLYILFFFFIFSVGGCSARNPWRSKIYDTVEEMQTDMLIDYYYFEVEGYSLNEVEYSDYIGQLDRDLFYCSEPKEPEIDPEIKKKRSGYIINYTNDLSMFKINNNDKVQSTSSLGLSGEMIDRVKYSSDNMINIWYDWIYILQDNDSNLNITIKFELDKYYSFTYSPFEYTVDDSSGIKVLKNQSEHLAAANELFEKVYATAYTKTT